MSSFLPQYISANTVPAYWENVRWALMLHKGNGLRCLRDAIFTGLAHLSGTSDWSLSCAAGSKGWGYALGHTPIRVILTRPAPSNLVVGEGVQLRVVAHRHQLRA